MLPACPCTAGATRLEWGVQGEARSLAFCERLLEPVCWCSDPGCGIDTLAHVGGPSCAAVGAVARLRDAIGHIATAAPKCTPALWLGRFCAALAQQRERLLCVARLPIKCTFPRASRRGERLEPCCGFWLKMARPHQGSRPAIGKRRAPFPSPNQLGEHDCGRALHQPRPTRIHSF